MEVDDEYIDFASCVGCVASEQHHQDRDLTDPRASSYHYPATVLAVRRRLVHEPAHHRAAAMLKAELRELRPPLPQDEKEHLDTDFVSNVFNKHSSSGRR